MKTILVPTDFSDNAKSATLFALDLANKINADILICHAIPVLVEDPVTQVVYEFEDYDYKKEEAVKQLDILIPELKEHSKNKNGSNNPVIEYVIKLGNITEVINSLVKANQISLIIIGLSDKRGLSGLILGSNTGTIINQTVAPVIVVPPGYRFNDIKKIAFASDLGHRDLELICSVSSLANYFKAEIFIIHIDDHKYEQRDDRLHAQSFLNKIINKTHYPNISYKRIKSRNVNNGLDWLSEHEQMNMLVMVHHHHNPIVNIFQGSHTLKLAKHVPIPLMVFSEGCRNHPLLF